MEALVQYVYIAPVIMQYSRNCVQCILEKLKMMACLPSGQDTVEEGTVIRRFCTILFIFSIMIGPKPYFNNREERLVD